MANDIPEKPAPGGKASAITPRKTSRKSKTKSASSVKKKTRSTKSKAAPAKAPAKGVGTADIKAAANQVEPAPPSATVRKPEKIAGAMREKTAPGVNSSENEQPGAGEKSPGFEILNGETEKESLSGPDSGRDQAEAAPSPSDRTATDHSDSPATPAPKWTPVPPENHVVADSSQPPEEEPDPMKKMIVYAGAGLALIVFLIFVASLQNMRKFYLVERGDAVEVWKGRFSPMAREKLAVLTGVEPPVEEKEVYTRQEVYPMLFAHFIQEADASMEAPGVPDFAQTRRILTHAGAYVTGAEDRAMINNRLQMIDRTLLIFKADLAAGRGTIGDLQTAQVHLQRAATLQPDAVQESFIQQKMASIKDQIALLKAGPAPEQKLEKPPAETAPPAPKSDEEKAPETETAPDKQAPAARGTT